MTLTRKAGSGSLASIIIIYVVDRDQPHDSVTVKTVLSDRAWAKKGSLNRGGLLIEVKMH